MSLFDNRRSIPGADGKIRGGARRLWPQTAAGWLGWSLAPVVLATALLAIGAPVPVVTPAPPAAPAGPNIAPVHLASGVQTETPSLEKASMVLALAGTHTMVGAQYREDPAVLGTHPNDRSYANTNVYIGYFDSESCYLYRNEWTPPIPPGGRQTDRKRFYRSGAANQRMCTEAFSGNFLNWASSTAMDTVRLALTGGDRYIDKANLTVLQRAVLPGHTNFQYCMWNSPGFPQKTLFRDGGGPGAYWGAIPRSMITIDMEVHRDNIYIANKENGIYFGTRPGEGDCGNTSSHTLGAWVGKRVMGSIIKAETDEYPPTDSVMCWDGGQPHDVPRNNCRFSGIREVWFGRSGLGGNPNLRRWRAVLAANGVDCSSDFFGVNWGPGNHCYLAPYNGPWVPPLGSPAQLPPGVFNSDGFFFARVQVCDSTNGVLDDVRGYALCEKYPNGKFKPTGVIQKYKDQMRIAAFGYLISAPQGRYGGLLRVPMKFVGHTAYDLNGKAEAEDNHRAEWAQDTGVLLENPDGIHADGGGRWDATSGVINYVNRLGRTYEPWHGVYTEHDPAGELHYEALRYLQGLKPSQAAVQGLETERPPEWRNIKDGFPFWTEVGDPYESGRSSSKDYSCLKSNILLIADDDTTDSGAVPSLSTGSGISANLAENVPDIAAARGVVWHFEKQDSPGHGYRDGENRPRLFVNPNPANPNVPSMDRASQIMGTAYWARTHDIRGSGWTAKPAKQRPGLRVKTLVYDLNRFGLQKHAPGRRTRNQLFMAAKYGGFEIDPKNPDGNPYNSRGNPFYDLRGGVPDELNKHGRADNRVWGRADDPEEAASYYFYDGSSPNDSRNVLTALDQMFRQNVRAPLSIFTSGMSAGGQLIANSVLYKASFDADSWSGNIHAQPLGRSASAGGAVRLEAPLWNAANMLDDKHTTERKIYMGTGVNRPVIELKWDKIIAADNAEELESYFSKARSGDAPDEFGTDRVAYLRGKRSDEGSRFRVRQSVLGDIIHSNIAYSGLPRRRYEGDGYKAFYKKYAQDEPRSPVIFAGANDGMLHAFDAQTGDEKFAYIPSWLVPRLSALTHPGYNNAHQSYVDGLSVVAEARTGTSDNSISDWKTVLVSSTGAGGSGVFALDVTKPDEFNPGKVMWEFTRNADSDLGQVVGAPKIMKIKISGNEPVARYRWFAVLASGVNNYVAERPGGPVSTDGKAALFLLALDKARNAPWEKGSNYYKVEIPIRPRPAGVPDTQVMPATGIINFSALYGSAGEMTDLYFGDLHGQVWRLDFAGKKPDDNGWTLDNLSFFRSASNGPKPLFSARSEDGQIQAISAAPALFVGPRVEGRETFYVLFGTGKYLEAADMAPAQQHSVYALFDNGNKDAVTHGSNEPVPKVIAGRQFLQEGSINAETRDVTVPRFTWGYPQAQDSPLRAGWYFDLPRGEQVDLAAKDLGALTAALNSKTAAGARADSEGGGCPEPGANGGGNQYVLNVNTGEASYEPSEVGLLGAPLFLSTGADAVTGPRDSTGRYIVSTTYNRIQSGIDGVRAGGSGREKVMKPQPRTAAGKLSWRRISNYRELKNAPATPPAGQGSGNTH